MFEDNPRCRSGRAEKKEAITTAAEAPGSPVAGTAKSSSNVRAKIRKGPDGPWTSAYASVHRRAVAQRAVSHKRLPVFSSPVLRSSRSILHPSGYSCGSQPPEGRQVNS
jgi:hypothetical protein